MDIIKKKKNQIKNKRKVAWSSISINLEANYNIITIKVANKGESKESKLSIDLVIKVLLYKLVSPVGFEAWCRSTLGTKFESKKNLQGALMATK